MQVRWDQPVITNGIIRYYTVVYEGENSMESAELNSTNVTTIVSELHPFTSYTFYVLAFTVAPSNASENETVLTAEAGNENFACMYKACIVTFYTLFSSQYSIKCNST